MSTQNKITIAMSPAQMFIAGIVTGLLVLCTVGFFLLGGFGGFSGKTAKANTNTGGGAAVVPTDNGAPSGPITLRDVDDTDHIRGNKNAKLTIVEYSDFECPFCQRFHPTMQQIVDTYGDDVRWVYRHFPLTSIHPKANAFAMATECAGEQGKFWEMADYVFENNAGPADAATLEGYAKTLGLNASKFSSCFSSNKYADKIASDAQDAQRAGGQGTPYSVLIGPNGEKVAISGAQPYASVEAAVQQFLN